MANEVLWGLVNTLIRVISLLVIERIFGFNRVLRSSFRGLLVLSGLHGLTLMLVVFLICRPIAAAWDSSVIGECGNQVVSYVSLEAIGALIDLVILALAPPMIFRLHIPWKKQVLYSSLLSVGILYVFRHGFLGSLTKHWAEFL